MNVAVADITLAPSACATGTLDRPCDQIGPLIRTARTLRLAVNGIAFLTNEDMMPTQEDFDGLDQLALDLIEQAKRLSDTIDVEMIEQQAIASIGA